MTQQADWIKEREAIKARWDAEAVPPSPERRALQLVHNAREMFLDRIAKYDDPRNEEWDLDDVTDKWMRHAYSAFRDLLTAEADLHRLIAKSEEDERELVRLTSIVLARTKEADAHRIARAKQAAELALREQRIEELEAERADLDRAIATTAHQAGIYNMEVSLTGPELIMLCADMSDEILRLRKANEEVWERSAKIADKYAEVNRDHAIIPLEIAARLREAARQSREGE